MVIDTGKGFSLRDLKRVSSDFGIRHSNSNGPVDEEWNGVGLSLKIVKSIAEKCKGKFRVRSEGSNQGSTFIFSMEAEPVDEISDVT